MFPQTRLRRNRKHKWLRNLIAETTLHLHDLIYPIFVIEGKNIKEPIEKLPDIFRFSIDLLIEEIEKAEALGISAVMLFPVIDVNLKDNTAKESYREDNLISRAIRAIKNSSINIGIICDVALDSYTIHGHDGLILGNDVDNDATIEVLCKQSLVLSKAGVDAIAPSDMMDGRIKEIRKYLDKEGFKQVNILSYAAKYSSQFYGPFRSAVMSEKLLLSSKATYQLDVRNSKEALQEIEMDIKEGADIVMIKPASCYLDIIALARKEYNIPIFAYQVSGEYAMLKYAALNGCFNWKDAILESLISIKRSGASAIVTYAAMEVAKFLK